jgi:HD superfamily phosphohydrolase
VHGDLAFPRGDLERTIKQLIDTPSFQRLRHIRQNGVTNLVFHGAEHSRFAHSMGVAWMAKRMLDAIKLNRGEQIIDEQAYEDTVLAALLHDVGHGPFSHTLEEILGECDIRFDHEHMTARLLTEDSSEIAHILERSSPGRPRRLVQFIDKTTQDPTRWYHTLVSSQLDADRLDYVLRDALMAGIDNHRPDITRLVNNLSVYNNKVVVDHRAVDVIESFLLALDHMYDAVYFHPKVRAAAVSLSAVMRHPSFRDASASPATRDPLERLLSDGQKIDLDTYIRVTDESVWSAIDRRRVAGAPDLVTLIDRLRRRELPREIELPRNNYKATNKIRDHAHKLLANENLLAGIDAKLLIIIDEPSRTSYKLYKPHEGAEQSILTWRRGDKSPRALEESQRTIVKILSEKFYKPRLFVPAEIHASLLSFCNANQSLS